MTLPNVNFTVGSGGLNRPLPGATHKSAMVIQVPSTYSATLDTSYRLLSLQDAEAVGITAANDSAAGALAHHHIKEFFRLAPGAELWVRLTDSVSTMSDLVDPTKAHAQALLSDADGAVRQLGVVGHSAAAADATEMSAEVLPALAKAQQLADFWRTVHQGLVVLVEGRGFTGTVASAADLQTAVSGGAPAVSVVLVQDHAVVSQALANEGYAAVGSVLGVLARSALSQSIAEVESFNLIGPDGEFGAPAIGDTLLKLWSGSNLLDLYSKRYILPRRIPLGDTVRPGVFLSDQPTCTSSSDDFGLISHNRLVNEAIRRVYQAIVPKLSSRVPLEDGKIAASTISSWEQICSQALQTLATSGDLSDFDVFIDPDQDILGTETIDIQIALVPIGIAKAINIFLYLTRNVAA